MMGGIDHTKMRIVMDELLRVMLVIRKNMIANEGGALLDSAIREVGDAPTQEAKEQLLAAIFPYVFGPGSLIHPLDRVTSAYDRGGKPDGSSLYNILLIVHRLDRSGVILKGFELYGRSESKPLPEITPAMVAASLMAADEGANDG